MYSGNIILKITSLLLKNNEEKLYLILYKSCWESALMKWESGGCGEKIFITKIDNFLAEKKEKCWVKTRIQNKFTQRKKNWFKSQKWWKPVNWEDTFWNPKII